MGLFIGTSGWAYKEWKPDFYPPDVPQRAFLEYYGSQLSACEINATFRRMQSPETIEKWRDTVPEGFRFSTKAHQGLTHSRQMVPDEDKRSFFDAFLTSVKGLGDKLGVVLWQYPPYRKRDDDSLSGLLELLKDGPRFALEFRDDSWNHPDVYSAIAASGGTVCVSETKGEVLDGFPPGPIAYVRLRSERYSEQARQGWMDLLSATAMDRDTFAFTKHEGIPAGDPLGGIGMARWLEERTDR
jgi:uncharacterized protein YecE (DUF72 family)